MSGLTHAAINVPEAGIGTLSQLSSWLNRHRSHPPLPPPKGNHRYPPQSTPTQGPQGLPNFVDGSGPVFSMYLEMGAEEDKNMAESWKADADGILIFVRLRLLISSFIYVTRRL